MVAKLMYSRVGAQCAMPTHARVAPRKLFDYCGAHPPPHLWGEAKPPPGSQSGGSEDAPDVYAALALSGSSFEAPPGRLRTRGAGSELCERRGLMTPRSKTTRLAGPARRADLPDQPARARRSRHRGAALAGA